jgi:dipeptidyl aminopeptidase/acylaminoacyl peptidase
MKWIFILVFLAIFSPDILANSHVATYGKLPFISDMKISPNGNKIAYLQDRKGKYFVVHQNISGTRKPKAFGVKKGNIRGFRWINDERIAVFMSIPVYSYGDYEQFTFWRMKLLNLKTNEFIDPFSSRSYLHNIGAPSIVSVLSNDPQHILVSNYAKGKFSLFKVDVMSGKLEKLESEDKQVTRLVNSSGETLFYSTYDKTLEQDITFYRPSLEADYKRLKIKTEEGEEVFLPQISGFDPTENYIYFIKKNEQKFNVGYRAEIKDGYVDNIKVVSQSKGIDLNTFVEDPWESNLIIGGYFIDDYGFTNYFDKNLAQLQADLTETFLNSEVSITSYDVKKQKFIVEVSGALYGVAYYLYDSIKGTVTLIGNAYPEHKEHAVSNISEYNFVATDGTKLNGYLTVPKTIKQPPLIVLPHGGPQLRDDLSFGWIRQFYAANGFAVLQVNFRGSSGYGEEFVNKGYGEWGKKMQTDLTDGVASLIKDNLIDKTRICIVGVSYGGYAALVGATKTPELYKCAVSFAGIGNLEDLFYHEREQFRNDKYLTKSIGDRFDSKMLKNNSPMYLISEKTSAILLLHGDKDTVVPIRQSRRMHKALEKFGDEDYKYIVVKGADHWLSDGDTRTIFLDESIKFIKKFINR